MPVNRVKPLIANSFGKMALPLPPRPDQPIPNNPFYYPEGNYIRGEYGPLILGGGLFIDYNTGTLSSGGTGPGGVNTILAGGGIYVSPNTGGIVTVSNTGALSLTAGNGIQVVNNAGNYTIINTLPGSTSSGTVTQVATGAGLTGGPITGAGTISLTTTGVGAGTYSNPTITVDAYGRITFAAPGTPSAATGILATAPLQVTAGLFPQTISISSASTLASGAVRLNDTVTSNSTTEAATPRAVKEAYDLASTAASNGTTAIASAAAAVATANNSLSIATTAQTCALQALTNAAIAQGDATQALNDAGSAQSTANTALGIATNAQTTANTALASANNRIPCSAFLAKGNLLAGASGGTYANVVAGTDGFVLAACSACSAGLTWIPAGGGGGGTGTVTSITAGTGLNGGTITTAGTIDLADTTVSPGSYTYGSFTVDQQGRLTAASNGTPPVTAVTGTGPVSVTAGTTPDVSVAAASTASAGVVQLNDTLSSNSTTQALTAAQGQILQDQINALSVATNLTFAGTFDATLGHMDSVTTEGTAEGFALNSNLPTPAAANDNFFVIVTTAGSYSPPGGGGPYSANRGDWFLSNGVVWEYLNVGADLPVASTGSQGVVELATVAETQAGTSTTLAVTPAGGMATYLACCQLTAKGTIITATAANTPSSLPVGGNGAILMACSFFPEGVFWSSSIPTTALPLATGTTKGAVCGCTNTAVAGGSTAIGSDALRSNTSGRCNSAFGAETLCSNTTGCYNTAFGSQSLRSNTTGCWNVAVGLLNQFCVTTQCANVSVGNGALGTAVGCYNTGIGNSVMTGFVITGSFNTAVGNRAACNLTSGNNNIAIGSGAALATGASSNSVTLGNSSITTIRAAVTTITSLSDIRDKTDIIALPVGLDLVKNLNPVKFTWQQREPNEVKDGKSEAGFIAQELQQAEDQFNADYLGLVYDDNPEKLEASPGKLIPVLVKAIQELSAKVDELEAKLTANG